MPETQQKPTIKYFSFLTERKHYEKKKPAPFKFQTFSIKQKQVLTWWREGSPVKDMDGIICDGSVRWENSRHVIVVCHVGDGDIQCLWHDINVENGS